MKIVHRLVVLILGAIIGLFFIGGAALYEMDSIRQNIKVINEEAIPSLRNLDDIIIMVWRIRLTINEHIQTSDVDKLRKLTNEFKSQRDLLEKELKGYQAKIKRNSAEKVALFQPAFDVLHDYLEYADMAIQLSAVNYKDEAGSQVYQLREKGDRAIALLNKNLNYNIQKAKKQSEDGDKAVEQAKFVVVASMCFLLVLASILGWLIYRQIGSGLIGAQRAIETIKSSLNFSHRVEVNGNDEISHTMKSFNDLIETLQDSLRRLRIEVDEVGKTSLELSDASQQVAKSSGLQSESSSHMATSIEQMTISMRNVAERAGEARLLSSEAGSHAKDGQQVISETVKDIYEISTAVDTVAKDMLELDAKIKEISSVIGVIKDVADQTNLLALNAAIEAARAGDSGRGFAVVADEVRKLAERTAGSTQEIGDIICAIQSVSASAVGRMRQAIIRVEQGVSGVNSAQQSMTSISNSSRQSVQLVSEMTDAISEQGKATTIIAQQVEKIAKMAEENNGAAAQAFALAERLADVSSRMRKVVSAYQL